MPAGWYAVSVSAVWYRPSLFLGNDILFGMVAIKKRNGFAADDMITFMALLEK